MKVLISLPVHECRRVIDDQIRNITQCFEDPTIMLHLSASYTESTDFSAFPNAIVNPVSSAPLVLWVRLLDVERLGEIEEQSGF